MFKIFLSIDYGKARLGLAIGQKITKTASPIGTIKVLNGVPNWVMLDKIVAYWNPINIIIGLPVDTKNIKTNIILAIKKFAKNIEVRYKKKFILLMKHIQLKKLFGV